jgi:hypothetical protein
MNIIFIQDSDDYTNIDVIHHSFANLVQSKVTVHSRSNNSQLSFLYYIYGLTICSLMIINSTSLTSTRDY